MRPQTLLFLFLQLCCTLHAKWLTRGQQVRECFASIERSEQDESTLEFNEMSLQVVQPETGKVIDSYPCTPDGNCFAVVQDMQKFSLKIHGPSSALFEPKQVTIDRKTSCEDLKFVLKGYACEIPVKFRAADGSLQKGPAGVPIKLKDNVPNGFEARAFTDQNGVAFFEEVPSSILTTYFNDGLNVKKQTGKDKPLYKVNTPLFQLAFHKDKGFTLDQPEGFIIEATMVEGTISQQISDSSPAANIKVLMQSIDDESVVFESLTDADGRYQFDSARPGKYLVSPQTKDTESKQFFKPQNRTVAVQLGQKTMITSFQVWGGSISGKVKSLKEGVLRNITIAVDGVNKTSSDEKGVYYLTFPSVPGEYTIEAFANYFIFDPMTVKVTEETAHLPDLQAIATYVCGKVMRLDYENNKYEVSYRPRTIRCLQEPNPLEEETWETEGILDRLVPERETKVNHETGEYCFTASVGLWRITADLLPDEVKSGVTWQYGSERGSLAFITNEAVSNLIIMQKNSTTEGQAQCLVQSDCAGLEIKMVEAGISKKDDRFETVTYTDEEGVFDFKSVPEMTLNVYVEKKHFCWHRAMQKVVVDRNKKSPPVIFQQKGYSLSYTNKIKMTGYFVIEGEHPHEQKRSFHIGSGDVCLEQAGIWTFAPDSDLFKLAQDSYTFDTSDPEQLQIDFEPSHVAIRGQLRFYDESTLEDELDNIGLLVDGLEIWEFADIQETEFEPLFRDFKIWMPYERIQGVDSVEVSLISSDEDSLLIFKPQTKTLPVDKKEPETTAGANFKVLRGMFVEGQTHPPVADVMVTIQRENQVSIKDRSPTTVFTDESGRYRYGPVEIDHYFVEMKKDSYTFMRVEGSEFDFKASRKAMLEIEAQDVSGLPLKDVFVTVSAGKTILKGQTDQLGIVRFSEVNAQKYYLTAIKKEYSFGSSAESIVVEEEEHKTRVIVGQRISFSAYGSVSSLQGRAITSGTVLARNDDSLEQALIQSDGTFRVMGLLPEKTYSFSVDSPQVERTLPNEKLIEIEVPTKSAPNVDVQDLQLVSIEKPSTMSIVGSAFFEGEETVKQLRSLYKEAPLLSVSVHERDSATVVKTMPLPVSHLFEFKGLSKGKKYDVVVQSGKDFVDRRHETSIRVPVEDAEFLRVIVPLKGKTVPSS